MKFGMSGQQAGKYYESLWEQWLEDVTQGRKLWPMADGRVNVSEFVEHSGISRNTVYKNPTLSPKIKAEIELVNAAALEAAAVELRRAKESGRVGIALQANSINYGKMEDYDKLKRHCDALEQKLAVIQPAYDDALRRNKDLELELRRYEFQSETGYTVGPY